MNVLVDTSIWSLGLRRRLGNLNQREQEIVARWAALIRENRAAIIGPIRQEILAGIRDGDQFIALERRLGAIPNTVIEDDDYVEAARFYSRCRSKGVTGSAIDLLICAVATRLAFPVFTVDGDFTRYAKHLPVALF
jgi:predicted nucleic acid-binding protein